MFSNSLQTAVNSSLEKFSQKARDQQSAATATSVAGQAKTQQSAPRKYSQLLEVERERQLHVSAFVLISFWPSLH